MKKYLSANKIFKIIPTVKFTITIGKKYIIYGEVVRITYCRDKVVTNYSLIVSWKLSTNSHN